MFTNLYDCHIKLNKAKPIKNVGFGRRMLFEFRIVINNFSVIPRQCLFFFLVIPRHGIWLRQGFQCFVGDLSGFNTVLDVIVLSQYGIKSQPLPVT